MKNLYYLFVLISINNFSQISFKTNKFIPLPKEPLSSLVADINNDGLNDVIIDYYSANYFSVMKQKANGELDAVENYTINGDNENISKIDIGDLNNDGRKDIITSNTKGTGIFFQNNDGTIGSFALRPNLPLGTYTIGDLNNDGLNDIFIISYNKIHFAYQNSNSLGTFTVTSLDKTWQGGATQIKDINNDNLNDIIIACSNISKIYTYRQKPEGGFLEPVITNATDWIDDIDVGDINNDGINDLVATKAANNTAQIKLFFPSFEDHVFFSYVALPAYELASSVKIIDFNNDGKNEIAVTHYAWNSFSVYSSVNNVFSGYQRFELPYTNCNSFYSLSVGDINNDGLADAVMAWYNGVNILINNSTPIMNIDETFKIKIDVYPNPASDFLNVKNTNSNSQYTISDLSGKIIKRGTLINSKIFINSLSTGYYILSIENQQIKFIKK